MVYTFTKEKNQKGFGKLSKDGFSIFAPNPDRFLREVLQVDSDGTIGLDRASLSF